MKSNTRPTGHRSHPLPLAMLVGLPWPVTGAEAPTLALLRAGVVGIFFALATRFGSARRAAIPVYARAATSRGAAHR